MDKGVVVGCDEKLEWILPWWYHQYRKYNDFPVFFADFGMSKRAVAFCRREGIYCPISSEGLCANEDIPEAREATWKFYYGDGYNHCRQAWFKKPLACLASPFNQGIWIDLDCQVKASLSSLFLLGPDQDIALVKELPDTQRMEEELRILLPKEISYNGGVVVFRKGAPILNHWVELVKNHQSLFIGDQHALSRAIYLYNYPVLELDPIYNWSRIRGVSEESVIHHYHGKAGKMEILQGFDLFREVFAL